MNRFVAMSTAVCIASIVSTAAQADRLGKGGSLILVGISGHTGEFASPLGAFFLPFESSQVGGSLAYGHFINDQWSVGIAGSYYVGREKANPNSAPLQTATYDTHSFSVRVGGDRYAFIDDNVGVYTGPGVFVTQGRAKEVVTVSPPAVGGGTSQGANSTGFGLDWRIGMYARLRKGTALYAYLGEALAYTSGKDQTGKVSWWSSSPEGSLGLAFDF